jgi:glutamate-ammonia-ligase adenylyltransferase
LESTALESAVNALADDHRQFYCEQQGLLERVFALSPYVFQTFIKDSRGLMSLCISQLKLETINWSSLELTKVNGISASNESQCKQALRTWRNRLLALITIRRISGVAPIESELQELSAMADCFIHQAYDWLWSDFCQQWGTPYLNTAGEQAEQHLMIVAMGKYGGYELNFSSDIDLIFFYQEDGETQGGRRNLEHQIFFNRFGQQLISLLGDVTKDGFVYRVDMRLRPYGDSGPLTMCFAAAEDYYQEQGREWERFAMIKARPVTGSDDQKQYFKSLIMPFVYRRYIDFGVLDAIRAMKSMIDKEVRRKQQVNNIKLGSGGIREAEFIVQSLQLIRGGRVKDLQVASFLQSISLLAEHAMMTQECADAIKQSYLFLRQVEHSLQAINDKQTQLLPDDSNDQVRLALALNFSSFSQLHAAIAESKAIIEQEFKLLLNLDNEDQQGIVDITLESVDHIELSTWFSHTETSILDDIKSALVSFVHSSSVQQLTSQGKQRLEKLIPDLLSVLATCEQPVPILKRILSLLKSINRRTAYLVLLQENKPILEQLVTLCGASDWISQQLAQYPVLLDELLFPNTLYSPLSSDDLVSELQQQLLRVDPSDEEQQHDQLRIFKQTNELRVAAAVISNSINVLKASRMLSDIAESILASVVQLSWQSLCKKYGIPNIFGASEIQVKGFCVIGYGKLGGQELGFGSDLDLVFLYDAEPDLTIDNINSSNKTRALTNSQFFTRLAQKVIHNLTIRTLTGVLYDVDMRLRPSGNSGFLVSHIEAFTEYQHSEAWAWEHQALTRARAVTGDSNLAVQFNQVRHAIMANSQHRTTLKQDVVSMRDKMRKNLNTSTETLIDLKQGYGTMVDIEFITQYLMLTYTHLLEEVDNCPLTSRTTRQLKLLSKANIIDINKATLLIEAYRFYREMSNRRLLTGNTNLVEIEQLNSYPTEVVKIWQSIFSDATISETTE